MHNEADVKFSVVIPCHDRLELLKEAIHTVLKQDWTCWELVIFDNGSASQLADYLKSLADPRIKYDRSDEFLPVTDSWNRAIDMATGDYVIFLGDDDGLIPHFFSRMASLIKAFENPEIFYSAFYQFMYPGVAPWAPGGYVADVKNGFFFVDQEKPFLLARKEAYKAVKGSVRLRRNFTFNIQAFTFSKGFLNRLRQEGPIFRSPFPDYYLANVAFAESKSTVVIPDPMSIVGVSKASVGYTVFNGLEDRFCELLNTKLASDPFYKDIEHHLLPGSHYNSNYVLTMEHVVRHARSFISHKVNYNRYRRLQMYTSLFSNVEKNINHTDMPSWGSLKLSEKVWAFILFKILKLSKRNNLLSRAVKIYFVCRIQAHTFRALVRTCNENGYKKLIDVFDDLYSKTLG